MKPKLVTAVPQWRDLLPRLRGPAPGRHARATVGWGWEADQRPSLAVAYALGGVLAAGLYFTLPAGSNLQHAAYELIGAYGLAGVGLGVFRNRPGGWSWPLILAGLGVWAAGDAYWNAYRWATGHEAPFPSLADAFYLLCYLPLIGGIVSLVRHGRPKANDVLDGAIVGIAASVVIWFDVIRPVAAAHQTSTLAQLVSAAYPTMDNLLLLALAQLVFVGVLRNAAFRWMVGAFTVVLVTDLVYAWVRAKSGYSPGSWTDAGYFLFYISLGAAALSPSMKDVASSSIQRGGALSPPRVTMLALALLAAPAVILLDRGQAGALDLEILAASASTIGLLVLARLVLLFQERDAIDAERQAAHEELARMAYRDALTGLANRAAFFEELDAAIGAARASDHAVAILFIDLDSFKQVNDRFGHASGDRVLQEVAQRLRTTMRRGDVVARHGGDEFLALVPDLPRTDEAVKIASGAAQRIAAQLNAPVPLGDEIVSLDASVGLSLYPFDAETTDDLLQRADSAMYEKKHGRGVAFAAARASSG
ncbi:MAG: GGDEF domain-containing protein [Actinomycetota bacterium]|nr:GGDEF domain-containing protein [Actinomycetota bacterium]